MTTDLEGAKVKDSPRGVHTFRSLSLGAQLDIKMQSAVRVTLGLRKNQIDDPCDEKAFNDALKSLGVTEVAK